MRRIASLSALLLLLSGFALAPGPITVHLVGDSTMAQKRVDRRPETGWGEALQQYFDTDRVRVLNHARNGRSTKSFIDEGRWQAVLDELDAGDYVFIQFGHNDQKADSPDRHAAPADYRRNLIRLVDDARARGANPVLLTPVVRRRFDAQGAFQDTHGEYPGVVRSVAAEHRVPLIDLHRASERAVRERGPEGSRRLFLHLAAGEHPHYAAGLADDTHFSPAGAELMASLVVEQIRALELGLARYLP